MDHLAQLLPRSVLELRTRLVRCDPAGRGVCAALQLVRGTNEVGGREVRRRGDSPVQRARLKVGDVVTEINGKSVLFTETGTPAGCARYDHSIVHNSSL